jgi:hypothetical protein
MAEENYYKHILQSYPPIVSKDHMYRICNISKKTAEFLLKSGIVPCEDSGKKTRRFKVKVVDIIDYLRTRQKMPEHYLAPSGWYRSKSKEKVKIETPISQEQIANMKLYILDNLKDLPDVMTVPQVKMVTGYSTGAICRWCRKKILFSFVIRNAYIIPKESLIIFMLGTYYRNIITKSEKHKEMLLKLKNRNNLA